VHLSLEALFVELMQGEEGTSGRRFDASGVCNKWRARAVARQFFHVFFHSSTQAERCRSEKCRERRCWRRTNSRLTCDPQYISLTITGVLPKAAAYPYPTRSRCQRSLVHSCGWLDATDADGLNPSPLVRTSLLRLFQGRA
jgi:hypothetical protein